MKPKALYTADQATLTLGETNPIRIPGVTIKADSVTFSGKKKLALTVLVSGDVTSDVIRFAFGKKTQVALKVLLFDTNAKRIRFRYSLGSEADVSLDQILLTPKNPPLTVARQIRIQANAKLRCLTGIFPESSCLYQDDIRLVGIGAACHLLSLGIATKSHRIQLGETLYHQAKQTVSELKNFLIATDGGTLDCVVSGIIQKGMMESRCEQANRGLLLGEKSTISVDPRLLIDEYDVKASHGAAIGRMSDDELFYLESRGLSEDEAKQLIVFGYLAPFMDQLGDAKLSDYLTKFVKKQVMGGSVDEPEQA